MTGNAYPGTAYYYLPGVCEVRKASTYTTWYYNENARGDTIAIRQGSGGLIVEEREYDGYGLEYNVTSNTGERHHRFAGKHGYYGDDDSGMLLELRYYLPKIGRFLTQDPLGQEPNLNLYLYCNDNPILNIDPTGRNDSPTIWGQLFDSKNWSVGLNTGVIATGEALSFGIYQNKTVHNRAGYAESSFFAANGREAFLAAVTLGAGNAISSARMTGQISGKMAFLLGKATGSAHNIERSNAMFALLKRIGLNDTKGTVQYLTTHFKNIVQDTKNIRKIFSNGRVLRESLIMGPKGAIKAESIWEGKKLITMILKAGN